MAFTEFVCRSGGNNMNGGAIAANTEPGTSAAYNATNGGWNSATGVFTPTSGNPSLTVTVGDFAHVFTDGTTGPTSATTLIGRVTAVNATTVTVSTTAKAGTAPTTAGTGISINVGGAWKGPNAAEAFPFTFVAATLTNSNVDRPRVNFKNDAQYNITAAIAFNVAGPIRWQGYTASFGDLGKATLDGGTSGASYALLTNSGAAENSVVDFIGQNNGATGSANGFVASSSGNARGEFRRCVVHDVQGNGFAITAGPSALIECEAYLTNKSNTANLAGFNIATAGATALRCISHHNSSGANCNGFFYNAVATFIECIADTNAGFGFGTLANNVTAALLNCDAYNNSGDGFGPGSSGGSGTVIFESCNFVKNGGFGINLVSGITTYGRITNCGFGSGSQANTSGATNITSGTDLVEVEGTVSYASGVTPWVDPANGDFRINLAAAINAGRGAFTQTKASYAGAIGYPDIGAVQHQETGGGGSSGVIGSRIILGM